jgi:hypothetical protein
MTAAHLQRAAQRGKDWAGQSTSINMDYAGLCMFYDYDYDKRP